MNALAIVLIVVALAIGAGGTFLFTKKKSGSDASISSEDYNKLCSQKDTLSKQLTEAKSQVATLEQQLNALSSNADISPEVRNQLFESEKLRKKVKHLQDEVENLEGNLEDAEKNLKSKKDDYKQLSEKADTLERDLKRVTEKIAGLEQDLELRRESLSFVQEILSAPELQNDDERIQSVKRMYDFVKGELSETLIQVGEAETTKGNLFGDELEKWAATSKKSWIAGKTSIAFVGEFSAGKTSIVNRLLSQDKKDVPLLPVSTKATTAIPTYISGGIKTDFRFFSHDNRLKKIDQETFMRVNKEVLDQVGGVSNLIQYFVMEYENSNLDNISILDTPGFSSNDEEDSRRTIEVINECDALFWVFDVNAGTINRSSLQIIKKHLHKPLYVIINKVDLKADQDVANVMNLIVKTFSEEGINLVEGSILTFSKKKPLGELNALIKQIGEQSKRQQTYLLDLMETVEKVSRKLNSVEEQKKGLHKSNTAATASVVSQLQQILNQTRSKCDEAEHIPDHKDGSLFGVLRKERYEMSVEGYESMCTILKGISSNMGNIKQAADTLVQSSKKEQSALEAYNTAIHNAKRVVEMVRKLQNNIRTLQN